MNINASSQNTLLKEYVKDLPINKNLKKYYYDNINKDNHFSNNDSLKDATITTGKDNKSINPEFEVDLRDNQIKIECKNPITNKLILNTLKIIKDYQIKLENLKNSPRMSAKEHFDQLMAIEPIPETKHSQARRLQYILSLLENENELLKANFKETQINLKSDELIRRSKESGHVIKRGDFFFFQMDAHMDELIKHTDYIIFLLQGQSLLDGQEVEKPIGYANYQFLDYFKNHSNEFLRRYATSLYAFLQNRSLTNFKIASKVEFFKQIDVYTGNIFWIKSSVGEKTTPLLLLLGNMIADITYEQIVHKHLDDDYTYYHNEYYAFKKQVDDFWLEIKNQQKELYCLAYQKLDEVVKSSKNKREFYSYKKNLTIFKDEEKPEQNLKEIADFCLNTELIEVDTIFKSVLELNAPVKQEHTQSVDQINKKKKKNIKTSSQAPQKIKKKIKNKKEKSVKYSHKLLSMKEETSESGISTYQPVEALTPLTKKIEKLTIETKQEKSVPLTFPFSFAPRVNRWFEHPFGIEFSTEKFPEYAHYSLSYQKLMHRLHGFNSELFQQFYEMGIKTTWQNPSTNHHDLCYLIPAEMRFEDKQIRGVISLAIDATGTCYHRYFKRFESHELLEKMRCHDFAFQDFVDNESENNQLLAHLSEQEAIDRRLGQAFGAFDYPTLDQAKKIRTPTNSSYSQNEQFKIDPILGSVYLTDPKKEIELILFRVKPVEII